MMKKGGLWVSLAPFLLLASGAWLHFRSQIEARVQFQRAQEHWGKGRYQEAVHEYTRLLQAHPKSRFADEALWEMANIHYMNTFDLTAAIDAFQSLVDRYPTSPYARKALLALAEIYEDELRDLPQAILHLRRALTYPSPRGGQDEVRLKLATIYFKNDELEKALSQYDWVLEHGVEETALQKAAVRAGMILQLQQRHQEAIRYFQTALQGDCSDCRLQARLGMIESYEFLGELEKAVVEARLLQGSLQEGEVGKQILRRLEEKQKYYDRLGLRISP